MRSSPIAYRFARTFRPRIGVAVVATVVTFAAMGTTRTRAATLPYHLDSLVFSADHIVEGTVVGAEPSGQEGVQVTFVEAGTLTVGQTIYAKDLFSRRKPGTGMWARNRTRLQPGDHLLLFLKGKAPTLTCTGDGTFLVVRGRVLAFKEPPMGTMNWAPDRLRHDSPTVREFRDAAAAERLHSASLHSLLDPPAKRSNAAPMLSLLSSRATPFHPYLEDRDAIADAAAARLAELAKLGDFALAEQALRADPYPYAARFYRLFSEPGARDYLIRRITDKSLPRNQRKVLIGLLGGSNAFRSVYLDRNAGPTSAPAGIARADGDLATWLRLAGRVADDEESAALILRQLEQPMFLAVANARAQAGRRPAAITDAERELRALYFDRATPDLLKYWIERLMSQIGQDAYGSLGSRCGPVMTLAEPLDLSRDAAPTSSTLLVGCDYRCALESKGGHRPSLPPVTAAYLVLEPAWGGPAHLLPSAIPAALNPSGAGAGMESIPLPPTVAPGKYHLHYRLMSGNAVLSDGHGFDTQIPQPGLRVVPAPSRPIFRPAPRVWRRSWTITLIMCAGLVLVLALARVAVRSRRRIAWFQGGRCHACGYDLRASGTRCPECGMTVPRLLPTQVLRRRVIAVVGAAMFLTTVMLVVAWIRSYFVGDLVTRTDFVRADAAYTSRGALVVQWLTIGSDDGWLYQRSDPADLPTTAADAGPPADWRGLGIEYSGDGNMLIVPLWMPALLLALVGATFWRARHPFLVPAPKPASKTTTPAAATSGAQSGSDPV